MSAAFDAATLRRARSAATLLASPQEGDRQAAWGALNRLTGGNPAALLVPAIEALTKSSAPSGLANGLTATDLSRSWQGSARLMAATSFPFDPWERRFLLSMANSSRPPTRRQADRLATIAGTFNTWRRANG